MLRYATILAATVALTCAGPVSNVFEIDISPEEAQKYLSNPPYTEPQLSGRTGVLPLVRWNDPRFRTAEAGPSLGHYWKNGHEIENTDDYVEEVYDASQYHGQDGLGAYGYGYQAPESAKVENRVRSGDVTGSYTYRDGNNELIKVRYWADSEGFHQEDNLPKIELKPAEETEEVREARLAHEKAWQEAAAAAALQPDPQGEYSARYEYQSSASEPQVQVASASNQAPRASSPVPGASGPVPGASGPVPGVSSPAAGNQVGVAREGKAYYSSQAQAQANYQVGQQQPYFKQLQNQGQPEEPEPTGPPRGFFYSFTYPVSIIVPKNAPAPR